VVSITIPMSKDSQEKTPIGIEYEAVWAPEPVWTFWRKRNSPFFAGNRTSDHPGRRL